MKARVEISSYAEGRCNVQKLNKLKTVIENKFKDFNPRENQEFPENGILIYIGMSAKYQTTYVKCSEWGNYQSVGEFERLIQEALEERCLEQVDTEWDNEEEEGWFKIEFE
jgi:hypothetical protein